MKQRRLIIPSILLLLVSFVFMTTASFAWFSINNDVTATGMQVRVKSGSTFLLIGEAATGATPAAQAEFIQQAGNHMPDGELNFAMPETEVFPCKPVESGDVGAGNPLPSLGSGDTITYGTAGQPSKWYTAQSDDPTSSTGTIINAHTLTSFTDYVIHKTFYLTVAEGANDAGNLSVKPTVASAAGNNIDAVRVLLVTDDGIMEIFDKDSSETAIQGPNNITADTVRKIDVYIYYDGSVAAVNTSNIESLDTAEISLEFNITPITTP